MYQADKTNMTFHFIAREDIKPDRQLTIHYNQFNNGSIPEKATWLKSKKIK